MLDSKGVLRKLIREAKKVGYTVCSIYDGEDDHSPKNESEIIALVFNLDECWLTFDVGNGWKKHTLYFIPNNGKDGADSLVDWGFCEDDIDGFAKFMDNFTDGLG